ncbi:MAG TPA: aromatic amino acid lyase [Thermoleophilaceae bacterium]|nr:aromatic amino acid lyase [Thermoleophilaceae bacterium]
MIVLERHDQLDLGDYRRVVHDHEPVEIDPALLRRVGERRRAMDEYLAAGGVAYGVTTGLGYLGRRPVAPEDRLALQRAILVGRAVGLGEPLAEGVVRGALLLRLTGFLSGHAGVTPELCRLIADRLNDGWYPVVPSSRPGTAGETIALCHLFQTFIGEGEVIVAGERTAAGAALARLGVPAYEPQLKEGLALINGAPLAPALAASLAGRAEVLLEHATLLGALASALVEAPTRSHSPRIGRLKGDPGQARVHARLAEWWGDAQLSDGPQAPVSLRVLPQVHGAAHDQLDHLSDQLERELKAVTDSPLYLEEEGEEPEGFYASGNFHSQALSLCLDAAAIAFAQVGALAEKRLHRLLDTRFSRLPEQLSPDPGRGQAGLVALHKAVVGLCAENRLLAAPASVHASDASSGQEDFQAFTELAADKLGRLLDNLELILAYELVALRQARELSTADPPPALVAAIDLAAVDISPVVRDRPLAPDVERARKLLRSGVLIASPRQRRGCLREA